MSSPIKETRKYTPEQRKLKNARYAAWLKTPEGAAKRRAWELEYYKTPEYTAQCRRRSLKSKYGLTLEDFSQMLGVQAGCCAGCGCSLNMSENGKADSPHVDHDHVSGKVRGILCRNCNVGIGLLGDAPSTLRRLAIYLEKTTA